MSGSRASGRARRPEGGCADIGSHLRFRASSPAPDCAPIRVRLLGEDLVAFRDTSGAVGLVDAYCPHRRAPLFFGRSDDCGLRCIYHGWKFERGGNCVDMPSEPAGTKMQDKVKLTAYRTFEGGDVLWAYLGPAEAQPPPPNFEWMRAPTTHRFVSKTFENCNYLQAMEGGFDSAHSSFLHDETLAGDYSNYRQQDRQPQIEVEMTDYGYLYSSTRVIGDHKYVRVNQYIAPFHQARGSMRHRDSSDYPKLDGHMWVPIDDTSTYVWNWLHTADPEILLTADRAVEWETRLGRGPEDYEPASYRLRRNQDNDYLIDREMQKTRNFSGIKGLNTQDFALQEGMGSIVDRSKEFLGSSDRAVIALRRVVQRAIDNVENGGDALGADPKDYAKVRGYDDLISGEADWKEEFGGKLVASW